MLVFCHEWAVVHACLRNLGWRAPEVNGRGVAQTNGGQGNPFAEGCEEPRILQADEGL
ncbi:hypothetical protein NOC27_1035 [Nitrosococcus oceani AFC27]|nr:hypothetical protein NOC27_1035 [Nitrosococcus oceani AFC27]